MTRELPFPWDVPKEQFEVLLRGWYRDLAFLMSGLEAMAASMDIVLDQDTARALESEVKRREAEADQRARERELEPEPESDPLDALPPIVDRVKQLKELAARRRAEGGGR